MITSRWMATARTARLRLLSTSSSSSLPSSPPKITSSSAPPYLFAVDGPDGTCADLEAVEEAQRMVNDSVDDKAVAHTPCCHPMKENHVNCYGPDSGPEAGRHDPAFVAVRHDKEHQRMGNIFAVDSPDGTPDDAILQDAAQVDDIIAHAAEHEDREAVLREHDEMADIQQTPSRKFPQGPFNIP